VASQLPAYQILVGSTRSAKVEAVRAALARIALIDSAFPDGTVHPVDIGAIAPAMPMSDRETLDGAVARARTLARTASPPFLALGLEGGFALLPASASPDTMTLVSWAAATDGARWGYGCGGAIAVPEAIAREVRGGRELGDVIDEIAGEPIRGTRGAWGMLTRDLVGRRDAFTVATLAALAPFYNSPSYESGSRASG
jgi:inosine/xanthosine triphosphatase